MKSLTILLKGGLGNQLFQYSAARAIADFYNCELYIDTKSGFLLDFKYKRKIEINKLNTNFKEANFLKSLPIWLFMNLVEKLFSNEKNNFYIFKFSKIFYLKENKNKYMNDIFNLKNIEHLYLDGYFQSPLYFKKIANHISFELLPKKPKENKFCQIAKQMQRENSVAICIRLYEESKDPKVHFRSGNKLDMNKINNTLDKLLKKEKDLKFYVFCTKNDLSIKKLDLPKNAIFLTEENGFFGAINNLWLIANCRHHIITNSSFYWWGAWLSPYLKKNSNKIVFISNEFLNLDCKPDSWHYF